MSSMKKASFEIALKDKKQIAEGTMAFVFEKPEGFKFKAGQHVRMTLINPPETDNEGDSRFMTLANTPQEINLVFAMRMRDTAFKRVLGRMRIGEKVLIQILLDVPHGAFALHDDSSKPAVMLAGGIGIIPAYSMIKDATERKLPHKIVLFYSNRRPEDAPFLDELEQLSKQNLNFKLIATMTEPEKSTKSWQGEVGRIDSEMLTKYVHDLQTPVYYIAGLPEMTSSMQKLLKEIGIKESDIHAEEFSGFNLNEIRKVPNHAWKRHVLIGAIVLVVVAVVAVHVGAAVSMPNIFSLTNPFFYILLVLMVVVIPLKFRHFMSLIHSWKKK